MTAPFPEHVIRQVTASFDTALTRRALVHAQDGQVHVVKPPPWPVVARVEGEVVTVYRRQDQLRGECSCDVAIDCVHAAAAALILLRDEEAGAEDRLRAAGRALVGRWLTDLGRLEREPAAPSPNDRVIAYVLDDRDGELGLTPMAATRLRRGGLGAGAVIAALADPTRGAPRWVDPVDLRRIAMLRAISRAAPDTPRVRIDRIHRELWRELADAGALFWGSTRGEPLRWGAAITDALRWVGERLGIDGDLVIVPARECHYVDVGASVIGPLELGVPPALVHRLISGPPVPASLRPTVDRSLRPLLGGAGEAEPMRPRLHAALDHDDPAARFQVQLVVEACYGDDAVPLASWEDDRPIARDLVAEGRADARLAELLSALPHGPLAASSMEVLADARYVAQVVVPALRAEGWDCTLADDFPHEAPITEVAWVERYEPTGRGPDWFAVELGVTIAGRTVPLLPILLEAIEAGELVIRGGATVVRGAGLNLRLPDGELVHVPAERLRRWLGPLCELELHGLDDDGALVIPAAAAIDIDDRVPPALEQARAHLEGLLDLAPRAAPRSFAGTLRPYQEVGHAWLRTLHDAGCGGLLADEMGLGKTIQVLAFLDALRGEGALEAALVIAPRSVVGNWQREAARFAPELGTTLHIGGSRGGPFTTPVVITSYQTLVRDLEQLRAIRWTTVILDEAQVVKNPDTHVRRAAAALEARSRFAITGTPIENHLGELWSQLDLAMPGLLGRRASFDAIFRRSVEKFGADAPLDRLRARIRPFLLRRTKAVVERDLPPKIEIVERIELDPAQRDLYETMRVALDDRVKDALASRGVHRASMTILDALLKLRQCCCDPRLIRRAEAAAVRGSAKLERLLTMLEELADSGRSTLVFSQFTSMLALIAQACAAADIPTLTLTGATRDRDAVVRRFQAGEAGVLLISLKAGGVGLNLTRADTVIHYDPWWNPAAEAQATDRAHRIGQDRTVHVYKLVARGTLEEAICDLQDGKRQLGAAILADGGVTRLRPAELADLFRTVV